MFTTAGRTELRDRLVEHAWDDSAVAGAALVGSAARDAEDAWSDVDLALQLAPGADEAQVVSAWTAAVDRIGGGTADTHDVVAGGVRYRVFLLSSSLQVDVSFWPHERFRSTGEPFRLLFGTPAPPAEVSAPDLGTVIGLGWLYALHARSAVARGRVWQAATMLEELRGSVLALRCARAGLQAWHGREVDLLSTAELEDLHRSHPSRITADVLDESRRHLTAIFLAEIRRHDPARADRLEAPFRELLVACA